MAPDYAARMFHPKDTARLHDERRNGLLGGAPFTLERRLRRRDGQYRWFLVHYKPQLDDRGYPTQTDESYAALKWIAAHSNEFGADGSRIAIAGNSVGGNMSAAIALMAKDKKGPKISL